MRNDRDDIDLATEWRRSNPDITVYIPHEERGDDQDNEHFLVLNAPKSEELLAFWTQSSCEGRGDNHIALARSSDGEHWSEPVRIAGTGSKKGALQASWQIPIVTTSGRIYCFFTKEVPETDASNRQGNGRMGSMWSDDNGKTWTDGSDIEVPKNQYDHPDPKVPKSWIVWQLAGRDQAGKVLAGYTQTTSESVIPKPHPGWVHADSRCAFMRFENIDEIERVEDLVLTPLPRDGSGIEVPNAVFPEISTAQEPSIALLPDGRLFVTMRTVTGAMYYAISEDDGESWHDPEPLRYRDDGGVVCHPMSPGPIYRLGNGKYLLLHHNNPGTSGSDSQFRAVWPYNQANFFRNPMYVSVGRYHGDAHQPIWFSQPYRLLDTENIPIGPKNTAEIGTYPSVTEFGGRRVLWYPDRKFYLLGKYIDDELLERIEAL
jgi:hypothetical protein